MLEWLTKNPQIIIFIIFGLVALAGRVSQTQKEAKARRERAMRSGRQMPAPTQTPSSTPRMDAGEAERTRRVQEEIRRKILARMDRANAPATMPRPDAQPVTRASQPPRSTPPPLPAARAQPPAVPYDESADAYRNAMEKLAEMQAFAATANAHNDEAFAQPPAETATTTRAQSDLLASLHNVSEIRRAFILREILDKPVSLRQNHTNVWELS
jgi:hypothetical protein